MIKDKRQAAIMAATIACAAVGDGRSRKAIEQLFTPRAEEFFYEVQTFKFQPDSFFIHQNGKGVFSTLGAATWADLKPEYQMAIAVYCHNVPLLASFITSAPQQQPSSLQPAAGRGFESINEGAKNTGSIYEREKISAPKPALVQTDLEEVLKAIPPSLVTTAEDKPSPRARPDREPRGEGGDVINEDDDEAA